ncbi:MAG: D-lyxose/D-mannose family sugar isomerase [Lachnospiraceae bacterium]
MKRSKINRVIKDMEKMMKEHRFEAPPFVNFAPDEWKTKGQEYDEIRDNMLGWDITDYGLDRFDEIGFALITLRNGNFHKPEYKKPYAEKLLFLYEGQTSPLHFHWSKMEDIINRGGNEVYITVYNGAEDGSKLDTDVTVSCDGVKRTVSAGSKICLQPGMSITIPQYLYHDFLVPKTGGSVLLGEVSMCNDDHVDNRFYNEMGRFPDIEEDEAPYRLLCNEYPSAP